MSWTKNDSIWFLNSLLGIRIDKENYWVLFNRKKPFVIKGEVHRLFIDFYLYALIAVFHCEKISLKDFFINRWFLLTDELFWRHSTFLLWGCSSAGRATRSQCVGQEFDPPHLHHKSLISWRIQGFFFFNSLSFLNCLSYFRSLFFSIYIEIVLSSKKNKCGKRWRLIFLNLSV